MDRRRPVLVALEVVQLGLGLALAQQQVPPRPPGQHLGQLERRVRARRDGEDVVELLERALFGFGEEEEDWEEGVSDLSWGCFA